MRQKVRTLRTRVKKMDMTHVLAMRNRLQDLISDEEVKNLPYLKLEEGSKRVRIPARSS